MIWHASSPTSWSSGPYVVHYGARCYSAWEVGKRLLGRTATLQAAMQLCEGHAPARGKPSPGPKRAVK